MNARSQPRKVAQLFLSLLAFFPVLPGMETTSCHRKQIALGSGQLQPLRGAMIGDLERRMIRRIPRGLGFLATISLSLSFCLSHAGNLVTLESQSLGEGTFEYRLSCNPQPYLERSGLSNFSLSFPGFDGVVQEPANWERAPGFPTPPQAEAFLQWFHNRTNRDDLPYQCAFRLRSQKSSFRLGTCQVTNLLHWYDWAQPQGYRTNVKECLTLKCLVPCDPEQSDGSPSLYQDSASAFPEINISECYLSAPQVLRLGIRARPGLPLCIESTETLNIWHRVGFLAASGLITPWTTNTTGAGPSQFYRAVAGRPEFAHPEALASTQWLEQNLGKPSVRIVDSRSGNSLGTFRSGHIPGAVWVDPLTDLRDTNAPPASPTLYYVPAPAQFEALMSRLGINNSTTVVVYDLDGGLWCARLWWELRYYGHQDVRLLQGGLWKWRYELRPMEQAVVVPSPTTYTAQAHPELRATFSEVLAAISNANTVILSGLPVDYYPEHIPSSKNMPAPDNLDAYMMLRLPPDALAETYARACVPLDKTIITYCGGGYYGAFSMFVLYQLGCADVRLYEGSWADWVYQKGPVETGPFPVCGP
jgi:thiosulfate/3-mercaptopyruvate sulfurtransferase